MEERKIAGIIAIAGVTFVVFWTLYLGIFIGFLKIIIPSLVITILIGISYYIFGKIQGSNIEKENKQSFEEQIKKLSENPDTHGLSQKISSYDCADFILKSEEHHVFYSLSAAQHKQNEINKEGGFVALIWKSQSEVGGGLSVIYMVFKLKYK